MKKIILTISLALFAALAGVQAAEMFYSMPKEGYVSDIPFNTYEIKSKVVAENAMRAEFEMLAEQYVDDIPFNTAEIAAKALNKK